MTCRKSIDGIETGAGKMSREESGGCLLIGQAVSGMKVARARFGLWCGTWEPVAPRPRATSGVCCGLRSFRGREIPEQQELRGAEYRVGHRGGPSRSSGEGPVMGPERRGRVVLACLAANRLGVGGAG